MGTVVERLKEGVANVKAFPTSNIVWPVAEIEKLLAAFEAERVYCQRLEQNYGKFVTHEERAVVAELKQKADAALRELEGE